MIFDFRKMLTHEQDIINIDLSLDEYLALEGDAMSRFRYKRKGSSRSFLLEAMAQMAMLFAAANMGSDEEYHVCLTDILYQCTLDDEFRRSLRMFYLKNITKIPGTLDPALARLALARPFIEDIGLQSSSLQG